MKQHCRLSLLSSPSHRKNVQWTTTLLMLFGLSTVIAQPKEAINYLGQEHPGMEARLFAPGIISTDAYEHSAPAFSPDGNTVLWAVMKMPSYQAYLLEMNFNNNQWSPAKAPRFCDTTANEVYPFFSADGTILYFSSNRKKDATAAEGQQTLWHIRKTPGGWSTPTQVDTVIFKKDVYASSVTATRRFYFTIGPHGSSNWDIFYTDSMGNRHPMPAHINSLGYEDGPFIAPDESYLIFESDRPTGIDGNIDLYITFKRNDNTWTPALNMGTVVNSPMAERFARVSPDGKFLFFGRNTGKGFDIYWITAAIITTLKTNAIKDGLL